jgi:hypothetical protein
MQVSDPATSQTHLRKWLAFLTDSGLWEKNCGLSALDAYSRWLPDHNVTAGAAPYVSAIRCRLEISCDRPVGQKMYLVVLKRLQNRLEHEFGIEDPNSAVPVFKKDLESLDDGERAVVRLFCSWGQRSIDYERAVKAGRAFNEIDGSIYVDNAFCEKTNNLHDAGVVSGAEQLLGLRFLAQVAGDSDFVEDLIGAIESYRSEKSGLVSLHSFRRTLAIVVRRAFELEKNKNTRRPLIELVANISARCGWKQPTEAGLADHKFFHYSRDWRSWSQPLAISLDDLRAWLPDLCPCSA